MRYRIVSYMALTSLLSVIVPSPMRAADQVETKSQPAQAQSGNPTAPPLTPEEQELVSIQEEGQARVGAVVQSMEGVEPGPALEALQAQVVQIKMDTLVRFLTARAGFARARGDETAAIEAEHVIDQILHPQAPATPGAPQSPDKSETRDGGRQ